MKNESTPVKKPARHVAWWVYLLVLISGVALFLFTEHDAWLYHQPVARVTSVSTGKAQTVTDDYNNKDQVTTQKLTVKVENTRRRGATYRISNQFSKSGGLDQRYFVGQQVFLHFDSGQVTISNYKRDTQLVLLTWLVVVALILTMRFAGLRALLSVLINFCLFLVFVQLDVALNLTYFFWLFAGAALLFTLVSLALILGLTKQFFVTSTAIITGTVGGVLLGFLAMVLTHDAGMHYEALDFATQSPKQLFMAATLIGVLGTVMDAATDVVATLFELKESHPAISPKQLFLSGREVGKAIMGPLINVLLLIFFAETFTMAILYLKTGNTYAYTFEWTMSLGLAQTLISGIGITLVIPAASGLAAFILGRE